jgi:hypothetical protein
MDASIEMRCYSTFAPDTSRLRRTSCVRPQRTCELLGRTRMHVDADIGEFLAQCRRGERRM